MVDVSNTTELALGSNDITDDFSFTYIYSCQLIVYSLVTLYHESEYKGKYSVGKR